MTINHVLVKNLFHPDSFAITRRSRERGHHNLIKGGKPGREPRPWWTCGGSTIPRHFNLRIVLCSSSSQVALSQSLYQEPLVLVLSCTRVVRMPVYPVPLPSGFSCTAGLPCTPELLPLITPPQKGASGKHCQGGFVRLRHNWDVVVDEGKAMAIDMAIKPLPCSASLVAAIRA